MHCCDTNASLPAVRLQHLDVLTATKLDELIGKLKRARIWNTRIMLFLNGGKIDGMEPFKVVKLPEDS